MAERRSARALSDHDTGSGFAGEFYWAVIGAALANSDIGFRELTLDERRRLMLPLSIPWTRVMRPGNELVGVL
jgi:hypothetical protein